ncbi:hypothetical protein B0H17DRAFT_1133399 [Mycena rosella]|uniref:Uncharacterized protein n=1 Tax=Mycena rosella TaxID=1033263 RepID=A0AAD7GFF2_MYCRO|nr:hypothetical protein B0H17DRAFT_1133399 [Mycena rosella]
MARARQLHFGWPITWWSPKFGGTRSHSPAINTALAIVLGHVIHVGTSRRQPTCFWMLSSTTLLEAISIDPSRLEYPNLPKWIQTYVDDGVQQKDMPQAFLDDHGIPIGLRSIEHIIKQHEICTTCHSGLTDKQKDAAILGVTQEDPLGRWGPVKSRRNLQSNLFTFHIFIDKIRGALDCDATDMRKHGAKKVHTRGLHSARPNKEWCFDIPPAMLPLKYRRNAPPNNYQQRK